MIDLRITLSKNDEKRLAQATDQAMEAIRQVIIAAVLKIDREAKLLISHGPKSGRWYGKHQASAPGEAPATDTGRLIKSIQWQIFNQGLAAEVGSPLFYASFLEDGTRKMDPRPWLRPAYAKHVDDIVVDITEVLKKYL